MRLDDATPLIVEGVQRTHETLMTLVCDERPRCRRTEPTFDSESSRAVFMLPSTGDTRVCCGIPSDNEFERLTV